jgi:hypothetical protein
MLLYKKSFFFIQKFKKKVEKKALVDTQEYSDQCQEPVKYCIYSNYICLWLKPPLNYGGQNKKFTRNNKANLKFKSRFHNDR